jgi:hypothetical protein
MVFLYANTSAFGSNSDGAFDVIATLYCRENDKHQTPSNVISQDIAFPTTYFPSGLRRFMWTRVIMNLIVQPHIDVVRLTSGTWQDQRIGRGKRDVLKVARETF